MCNVFTLPLIQYLYTEKFPPVLVLVSDIADKTTGDGKQLQSLLVNNLEAATEYTIRMASRNFYGSSNYSDTQSFTTNSM